MWKIASWPSWQNNTITSCTCINWQWTEIKTKNTETYEPATKHIQQTANWIWEKFWNPLLMMIESLLANYIPKKKERRNHTHNWDRGRKSAWGSVKNGKILIFKNRPLEITQKMNTHPHPHTFFFLYGFFFRSLSYQIFKKKEKYSLQFSFFNFELSGKVKEIV